MNTALQVSISFKAPDLGSMRAATTSFESYNAMPRSGKSEKALGGDAPIGQFNGGPCRSTAFMDETTRSLHAKFERGRYLTDADLAHGPLSWGSSRHSYGKPTLLKKSHISQYHVTSLQRIHIRCADARIAANGAARVRGTDSQWSDPGAKPFVLLERARNLLSEQRVHGARNILKRGAINYPEDIQIARLLRVISPGRVRRVQGNTPSRTREAAWIQQHGHKYRGKWVAVSGDQLVGYASNLGTLLAEVNRLTGEHNRPVFQKIAPEVGNSC